MSSLRLYISLIAVTTYKNSENSMYTQFITTQCTQWWEKGQGLKH